MRFFPLLSGVFWNLLTVQVQAAETGAGGAVEPGLDPVAGYLRALESSGRLPAESATAQRLKELLVEAEQGLIRGDARSATTDLFGVVESPRFSPLASTPAYQNAEFLLGRALFAGRAYRASERYLGRVLARGPQNPYFVPAFRVLVDLALDTHRFGRILALLESVAASTKLPEDSFFEFSYLRGRVAYGNKVFDEAAAEMAQVGKTSRLYPAAQYFKGLASVQQGALDDARDAFCSIADQKDQDRVTFNVDRRYFQLKDLARLALGRLAHERDAYDEAYYFYFSIPDDSPRLGSALFEASWSMMQKGEFVAARAFADQFDRLFPDSPLRPEITILRAHLAVKTCAFDRARQEATQVETEFGPLQRLAEQARTDKALQARLIDRLIKGVGTDSSDPEGQLLRILKLDETFGELVLALADIDDDVAESTASAKLWRDLGARAKTASNAMPVPASNEAVVLLEEAARLADLVESGSAEFRGVADLVLQASLVAYPPQDAGPYANEARQSREHGKQMGTLRGEMIEEIRRMVGLAVTEVDERLRSILGETRLVHIDAVVGKKKKLEIQIGKLTGGTLTPEVYRKLAVEGTISDDEIYWPYEGEMWADEYENFR